ncbi:MAG: thioredoxin domain-containing protein [ANME-2 cluster archaeon]|nr:thioredoxin domain-containing protein [ANME-2 cluster archaeon]
MDRTGPPTKKANRLIAQKSPYLLQHAYNPVDWYSWGQEAFEKAKKEDKPIFLSIGYSTCHWCHVMEQESFEDEGVAELMNEVFVSIKVDREERPDIDSFYMAVCTAMTGSGGWPLNIIISPDKKPIFAGTYIPKRSMYQRVGMLELVPRIRELWDTQRKDMDNLGDKIISSLREVTMKGEELTEETLHNAYEQLFGIFDEQHGGFGNAPKFPSPHNLNFLLRYWKRTGDEMALHMVVKTLEAMSMGGIYDHIGFGFHRYSTDSRWLVPHFEKMLYDQALLTMAYIEGYQATGTKEFKNTAKEVFTYVLRDMTDRKGGFYSAQDADSEGVEGKFYVWTLEEIQGAPGEHADLAVKIFNITYDGNFRDEGSGKSTGKNIPYLKKSIPELALELGMQEDEFKQHLGSARDKLFTAREKRIPPGKDDKILADWNGLMIAALAKGARVFNEYEYEKAATKAADFILRTMRREERGLYHRYREGESDVPAFLDDYAFFVWGLLELYETTFDVKYLKIALELTEFQLKHFWDEENGGFFFTSDEDTEMLFRKKEFYDGAVPAGNSIAMQNLLRLGRMTGNSEFEKKAIQTGQAFSGNVSLSPAGYTMLMQALDFAIGPSSEVVIAGNPNDEDTKAMLETLRHAFIPNKVVIFHPTDEESPEIANIAGFVGDLKSIEGKATAYVCQDYACKLPTNDKEKMLELFESR